MTVTTTQLSFTDPAASFSAAAITIDNVRNVEDVVFFLTKPGANGTPVSNGAIQADYDINPANGGLTVRDTVFYQPTGGIIATYYGNEATNPLFTANPTFAVGNPGYAFTQYTYSAPGVISQIVAHEANGQTFIGV